MPQPLSVFDTAGRTSWTSGHQRYWVQEKRAKHATFGCRHLSMFFSSRRGISLEVLVRVLPFRRVKVPVIVSSLLRQRLGNNFAAQEEGKSQF